MDNISLRESQILLFNKLFKIGEIKIGPKVVSSYGMSYGRVQIISRKPNPFLGDYQYISIYDDNILGCNRFSGTLMEYLSATSTYPSTLYEHLTQIYASVDKEFNKVVLNPKPPLNIHKNYYEHIGLSDF